MEAVALWGRVGTPCFSAAALPLSLCPQLTDLTGRETQRTLIRTCLGGDESSGRTDFEESGVRSLRLGEHRNGDGTDCYSNSI